MAERAIENVEFGAENPYADVTVSALPEWWRENLQEFDEHDLQTYLPSRFEDGVIVQREVERLVDAYAVNIQFIGVGVSHGDDWEILVDHTPVATVNKRRITAGYTVFELSSGVFERLVTHTAVSEQ